MADAPARKPLIGQAKSMEQKGGKRSGDSTSKPAGPSKISKTANQESSGYGSTGLEISKTANRESSGYGSTDLESTILEVALTHTRRLTVSDKNGSPQFLLRREGEKSGQDTVLRGNAELKLHVDEWLSIHDETHLKLRKADCKFFKDFVLILAPLCPAVKHLSIDVTVQVPLVLSGVIDMPMLMSSVFTVCIKSVYCLKTLHEALLTVSKYCPNAESLDMQIERLGFPSNRACFPEVNTSSSLRELKLRYITYMYQNHAPKDRLFVDISTSCPNIVSLVLSGIGRFLSNKSGKDIPSFKLPHLTSIHLEPFGMEGCCRFETLTNVLHAVHLTSPRLKFVEAKQVQLGGAELASVTWFRTSSGYELQHEGAYAVVPMADLMHLVSNELEGVTVLTFDRCNLKFPQSISHPPHSTEKESSLRELKFLNVENPLPQTDIHKLSEMYPNVKVTVEHESEASHEDSKQGTGMPFKRERKTSPFSPPSPTSSIDGLFGATARVQVHEEQTDTQNTEEEENEEKKGDSIATESLLHETDELAGATARVQVHEEQTDTQNTEEVGKAEEEEEEGEGDYIAMESLPHETDEETVKPIKMECFKRVGVEGGRLQLDSFGIGLEIPPGAIDNEVPQDISLRVLTDTPNLGNSKEEMSVCFGVQCLAPDDLVLKLPVTYTIPHCAVITRYSNVKAVLYTGEGEYSPDAVVKERIVLSRSGTPNCIITKDVLKLKMNHFSWSKIKLWIKNIKNIFLRGKKMCCWPFKENNLALQRMSGMLHAHLYDAIKGNSELVESKELKYNFIPAAMEQEVLIQPTKGHLKMTCYVEETVVKEPVVSLDKLMSGTKMYEPFKLDLTNHPDGVAVLLEVGQNKNLEVHFEFQLEDRRARASPQDQEQVLQGVSSSKKQQTSRGSTGETQENRSGKQDDFDKKLTTVARIVATRADIDNLMTALGLQPGDIQHYANDNKDSSYMVTLSMLRDWRKKQTKATECEALKDVLEEAGQIYLADELFGTS